MPFEKVVPEILGFLELLRSRVLPSFQIATKKLGIGTAMSKRDTQFTQK